MPCPPPPDTAHCPLCGQPNQCAIAAGQPAQSCWCMQRTIPAAALAALPADRRGTVCICPACGAPAPAPALPPGGARAPI